LQNKIKILVVGDIVGKGARNAFIRFLPCLKEKYNYDIIAINAENTTHGKGLNYKHYLAYENCGIDVMTMGNHMFDNDDIFNYIEKADRLVVPGNVQYKEEKFDAHKVKTMTLQNHRIKFVNLLGQSTSKDKFEVLNPLTYFDQLYQQDPEAIYIVDYHAEFTLEKNLLAYYLDGRASLVYGTHTHVQTADERILPQKTAFISDVGMCGSIDSVIGYDYQSFLNKLQNNTSTYVSLREPFMINALLVEVDLDSKQAVSIMRINQKM